MTGGDGDKSGNNDVMMSDCAKNMVMVVMVLVVSGENEK